MQFMLGPANSGSNIHYHTNAWCNVIHGRKRLQALVSLLFHNYSPPQTTSRWFLFPPSQAFLSAIPISNWLQGEYTLLEERPFECYQNPGDIVFVPESWGHGGQLSLALPFPPPQPVGFPHNLFVLSSVVNIHDTIAVSMELMRYYSI